MAYSVSTVEFNGVPINMFGVANDGKMLLVQSIPLIEYMGLSRPQASLKLVNLGVQQIRHVALSKWAYPKKYLKDISPTGRGNTRYLYLDSLNNQNVKALFPEGLIETLCNESFSISYPPAIYPDKQLVPRNYNFQENPQENPQESDENPQESDESESSYDNPIRIRFGKISQKRISQDDGRNQLPKKKHNSFNVKKQSFNTTAILTKIDELKNQVDIIAFEEAVQRHALSPEVEAAKIKEVVTNLKNEFTPIVQKELQILEEQHNQQYRYDLQQNARADIEEQKRKAISSINKRKMLLKQQLDEYTENAKRRAHKKIESTEFVVNRRNDLLFKLLNEKKTAFAKYEAELKAEFERQRAEHKQQLDTELALNRVAMADDRTKALIIAYNEAHDAQRRKDDKSQVTGNSTM